MYFLLILSHKKSTHRDSQRAKILSQNNGKFIFYYFLGDPNLDKDYVIDEPNNIVYLKVPDNYESLSLKTYNAIKFISENYPQIEGIFKTDDDIDLDIDKLYKLVTENNKLDYYGEYCDATAQSSDYHFGKCEGDLINHTRIYIPDVKYCAGGGYYVSNRVINTILKYKYIYEGIIFEDVATGVALNRDGIIPSNVDVKSSGSSWGVVAPVEITFQLVQPNPNQDRCSCGEIRNRRMYNFCQKCGKLY